MRINITRSIITSLLSAVVLIGGPGVAAQSPGMPADFPHIKSQQVYVYTNPYEQVSFFAIEAVSARTIDAPWVEFIEDADAVEDYIDDMAYTDGAEEVNIVAYGEEPTGWFAASTFTYDTVDEADAAIAFQTYLSYDIATGMGYFVAASKDDTMYVVFGVEDQKTPMEDVLTWAVRDGGLPEISSDFTRHPVND